MGCVILFWHSLGLPYNYFIRVCSLSLLGALNRICFCLKSVNGALCMNKVVCGYKLVRFTVKYVNIQTVE